MDSGDIVNQIKEFKWNTLQRMYGSAHSSIIGFISTEWINKSKENSILDGPPSPLIGKGWKGQKHADILLCKKDKPFIVVEVETEVKNYSKKIDSIIQYLGNNEVFNGLKFGLLFMSNLRNHNEKYKHKLDQIKEELKKQKFSIALVSVVKEKSKFQPSVLSDLRNRNVYSQWEIDKIDYWIHTEDHIVKEGNLWKK